MNEEQFAHIKGQIDQSAILSQTLKDDLLDHLCCQVEEEIEKGAQFKDAYDYAIRQVCPAGIDSFGRESIRNNESPAGVPIWVRLIGMISFGLIFLGALFKILHLPGASVILGLGGNFFVFVALPLWLVKQFNHKVRGVDKALIVLGLSSLTITFLGALLKILHYPGAAALLAIGLFVGAGFFILLAYKLLGYNNKRVKV